MLKFSELPYVQPSKDEAKRIILESKNMLKRAATPSEACDAYLKLGEAVIEPYTAQTLAQIRSTLDVKDEYYATMLRSGGMTLARVLKGMAGATNKFIASPYRKDLEERFGPQTFRYRTAMQKANSLKVVRDMMKESALVAKYSKLTASCSMELDGEKCGYYDLLRIMQSADRNKRRDAYRAIAGFVEGAAPELDAIYDEMLKVRIKKAKKLGYEKYIDYAYASKMRFDYTPEDTARFRDQVFRHITPIYGEIAQAQRERLGVETLTLYDAPTFYIEGNPGLTGDTKHIIAAAGKMFEEMSGETGEFFRYMTEYEMMDLEARPGKRLGGFALFLPKYKAPFICTNFNGTNEDVFAFTHEGGHAFQSYYSSRRQELSDYIASTSEINELHAMAMELLTYPWMELFFGDNADKYRAMHLARRLYSILYHVCVDEFQEEVYKDPGMSADRRRETWKRIEKKYVPSQDYDGNAYLESGGAWMMLTHPHIFLSPFYIIEYSLAQICAYQYYLSSLTDREAAWADYLRLCAAGGSKGYFDLLREGNLKNPFAGGVVREVTGKLRELIKEVL
jgi:M3 family oligoendopeptidase